MRKLLILLVTLMMLSAVASSFTDDGTTNLVQRVKDLIQKFSFKKVDTSGDRNVSKDEAKKSSISHEF